MNLVKAAASGLRWSAIEHISQQAMQLGIFVVLARLLGPSEFGLVAVALVFVAVLQPVANFGMDMTLIQRKNLESGHINFAFIAVLLSSVLLCLLLWVLASTIASIFDEDGLEEVIKGLACTIPLRALIVIQDSLLRRDLCFRPLAIRSIFSTLIGGGVGIATAYKGFGALSIVAQHLSTSIISLITITLVSGWKPAIRHSAKHRIEVFQFARAVIGFEIIRVYNRYTPNLFVGYFFGSSAAGIFAIADRLLYVILTVITQTANRVIFPLFSKLQSNESKLLEVFYVSLRGVSLISLPLCCVLIASMPVVVPVALGVEWQSGVAIMQMMMLMMLSTAFSFFNASMLVAIGRPDLRMHANLLRAMIGTLLFLTLHVFGLFGMVAAFLIRGFIAEPLQLRFLSKSLRDFQWSSYMHAVLSGARAAVVTTLAVAYMVYGKGFEQPSIAALLAVAAMAASAYGLSLFVFNRKDLVAMFRFIRQ
jgi:O-antigen/teichoic acid export membrane protein